MSVEENAEGLEEVELGDGVEKGAELVEESELRLTGPTRSVGESGECSCRCADAWRSLRSLSKPR